jgi:hypothetical protein
MCHTSKTGEKVVEFLDHVTRGLNPGKLPMLPYAEAAPAPAIERMGSLGSFQISSLVTRSLSSTCATAMPNSSTWTVGKYQMVWIT